MSYNRLLTDLDREYAAPTIELMWDVCPDVMSRKFPRANVQQAFVLDAVRALLTDNVRTKLLSAGCFDDTAYEALKRLGWNVVGIDPAINVTLHEYTEIQFQQMFDCVFSTSVLEHVVDDMQFVEDMCKLLKPGGYGILTMDFKGTYVDGDRLPHTDLRFYTVTRMLKLVDVLKQNGCSLVDQPNWTGQPDFEYDGCTYSFATLVFQKLAVNDVGGK